MFPSQKCGQGRGDSTAPKKASMRPGCFHPRNQDSPTSDAGGRQSFNEAGMFPSQKSEEFDQALAKYRASMRPGCFHPRNPKGTGAMSALLKLQ